MKRFRWVAFLLIAFFVLGSFSITLPRAVELVDSGGAPHATAYIAYLYEGGRPNLVHPITHQDKPLALARADSSGRVSIPIAFHAHLPFPIATHPSLRVAGVYAPRAHNALGQMNEGSPSRPGVFEIESVRRAVIYDVSDRPELWQGSLMNLASLIHRIAYRPGQRPLRESDPATAALSRELIGHFREEYDSFLTRYGSVPRPMPGMALDEPWTTAEQKRRRREAQEESWSREPLWGQLISRTLGDELKALGELERELAHP